MRNATLQSVRTNNQLPLYFIDIKKLERFEAIF